MKCGSAPNSWYTSHSSTDCEAYSYISRNQYLTQSWDAITGSDGLKRIWREVKTTRDLIYTELGQSMMSVRLLIVAGSWHRRRRCEWRIESSKLTFQALITAGYLFKLPSDVDLLCVRTNFRRWKHSRKVFQLECEHNLHRLSIVPVVYPPDVTVEKTGRNKTTAK